MSNVTNTAFVTEVMTSFAAFWAGRTQIASPNDRFDPAKVPADDDAWVAWSIAGGTESETRYSSSVERNHFSEEGTITFIVSTRLRVGSLVASGYLDAIKEWLEAVVLPHGVFRGLGTPVPLGDDGAWYQVSLSANWLYFTDRPSVLT